ncbi:MAG TPA: hypothetical protein VK787_00630 [Puia sp.]|jgi:hypothetical protein|nr:hypothetical protein [Puia sp.]
MQYLNDDNMDELFRRAADDYPLNTDSANWDKVNAAMQTEDADSNAGNNPAKKNSYRKYLWLLLLLPMAWICNGKFFMNDSKQGEDNVTIKKPQQPEKTSTTKIKKTTDNNFDSKSTQLSNTQKKSSEKNITSSKTQNTLKSNQSVQLANATLTDRPNSTTNPTVHQNQKIKIINNKSDELLALNNNNNSQKNKSTSSANKKDGSANTVSDNDDNSVVKDDTKNNVAVENKTNNTASEIKNDKNITDKNIADNDLSKPKTIDAVNSGKVDSTQKQVVPQASKKNSPEKTKIHFLYAGIVGGADVSTVEFQSVKNTGYTAGVLLGYQLNKKLSIESGFLVDKKFYYTDAKDFSTKKVTIYPGWTILNVTGNCFMFELPVNIKYNWTSTAKSNWFSTVGMSSYFMKKEDYNYRIESSPQMQWSQSESYPNSSVNWFGVINLSGGYMHTLGKTGSLRVEPYLKIPVQGLGVGSLSVWSTGIYVSFIKKIF